MSFAVDVNVLLYASNAQSPLQPRASAFLQASVTGQEIVYLAWPTLTA